MSLLLAGAASELRIDPPVLLAPLAGITDLPFRRLVALVWRGSGRQRDGRQRGGGAGPPAGPRARRAWASSEAATSVQLAGREPYWMAEAARYVEGQGARVIDINMGCPAKRVTTGYSGSALMRTSIMRCG